MLALVCADCNWVALKYCSLIQKPCDMLTGRSKVHCNVNARVAEVIDHSEAFDSSAVRQTVRSKIHALNIFEFARNLKRHTRVWWTFNFSAGAAHHQVSIVVEPVDTFVIHPREF